ncbi:MAG: hypothetical protein EHM90_04650, partial [Chloroflexi bacterium]
MTTLDHATSTSSSTASVRPKPALAPARVTPETELTLLLDVGSAWTKAALVGRAGGRWRIVSGAAQPTAWGDAVLVEDLVGRLIPHADSRLHRRLPLLVREAPRITCRSPQRPGRLAVAADTTARLEAATGLAIRSGWTIEAGVAGDDRRTDAERFELLRAADADAWLAVPSTTGGSGPLWGLMAAALGASRARVLVVGRPDELGELVQLLGTRAESVAEALDEGLTGPLLRQLTSLNKMNEARTAAPVAFSRAVDALATGLGISVLGVDLGASWLAWRESGSPGRTAILAATPMRTLPPGSRAAAEILPADADEFTTTDAMAGLTAHRSGIPATSIEAAIAQAVGIDRLAAAR